MTTSIIDGHVAAADLKRARSGISIYRSVTFQPDQGAEWVVKNAVVKQNVADALLPGARGRFYLYSAFDVKGIHGVRTSDGQSIFGFPGNNQKLFLVLGIFNLIWVAFTIVVRGGVPLLGAAGMVLCIAGYIFMSKGQREAQAQFDGDAGHVAK